MAESGSTRGSSLIPTASTVLDICSSPWFLVTCGVVVGVGAGTVASTLVIYRARSTVSEKNDSKNRKKLQFSDTKDDVKTKNTTSNMNGIHRSPHSERGNGLLSTNANSPIELEKNNHSYPMTYRMKRSLSQENLDNSNTITTAVGPLSPLRQDSGGPLVNGNGVVDANNENMALKHSLVENALHNADRPSIRPLLISDPTVNDDIDDIRTIVSDLDVNDDDITATSNTINTSINNIERVRPTSKGMGIQSIAANQKSGANGFDYEDSLPQSPMTPVGRTSGNGAFDPSQPDVNNQNGNHQHTTMTDLYTMDEAAGYCRIAFPEIPLTDEDINACETIRKVLRMRDEYVYSDDVDYEYGQMSPRAEEDAMRPYYLRDLRSNSAASPMSTRPFEWSIPLQPAGGWPRQSFGMVDGVMHVWNDDDFDVDNEMDFETSKAMKRRDNATFKPRRTANEFFSDFHEILHVISTASIASFCYRRLSLLDQKFSIHRLLNGDREFIQQKAAPHRDFYNVRKVDTHIHHSSCMNQKHLLRFIKKSLKRDHDTEVLMRNGKVYTLKEVFESLQLTAYDLSIDTLDMHAHSTRNNTFFRFDKFNLKYNPIGQPRLREIFLKHDNYIKGQYLADITKEVMNDLTESKYSMVEWRISIYGKNMAEWDKLSEWISRHELANENVVWLIQIPRLYLVYKESGLISNFEELLNNIFKPLFEVSMDPSSHPDLHTFLKQVVGFDIVDDESKVERRPHKTNKTPREWNVRQNPAYSYWLYYIYANIKTLNDLRRSRGLSQFTCRPHCGEAGDIDHLAAGFLLANNISHGIILRKSPCLQYLYYLAQIGICVSPLSNNSLFLDYSKNPFPLFHTRGLFVSLSTDDPLQIHLTKEALVEEYSIAAQVWKLTACDLCEIARNSVLHSGFPNKLKSRWIGGTGRFSGNSIEQTNVPDMRLMFRRDMHLAEMNVIDPLWDYGNGDW